MSRNGGMVLVVDMESTLADSLARRLVDMGQHYIYREWDADIDAVKELEAYAPVLRGIILSGSSKNVNSEKYTPPGVPAAMLETGVPVLGICYGMQHIAHVRGQKIVRCWNEQDPEKRSKAVRKKDPGEQGPTMLHLTAAGAGSPLFQGIGPRFPVWMKHHFMVEQLAEGWTLTASTARCPIAAMEYGNIYAVQFHPEPYNSLFGRTILHNFLYYICKIETPYF